MSLELTTLASTRPRDARAPRPFFLPSAGCCGAVGEQAHMVAARSSGRHMGGLRPWRAEHDIGATATDSPPHTGGVRLTRSIAVGRQHAATELREQVSRFVSGRRSRPTSGAVRGGWRMDGVARNGADTRTELIGRGVYAGEGAGAAATWPPRSLICRRAASRGGGEVEKTTGIKKL